ncbi:AAA domain-containing protein [Salana multivorans]
MAARAELARLVPYVLGLPGLSLPPTFNPLRDDDVELLRVRIAGVEVAADLGVRLVLPEHVVAEALRGSWADGGAVRELVQARAALLAALGTTDADLKVWLQGERWSVARERTRLDWEADVVGGVLLQLERWVRVRTLATRLESLGGCEMVQAGLTGALRGADAEPAVRLAVAREVLQERLDSTDLRAFDPEHHSRLVERFISTGEDVRSRLVAELPARIIAARTFDANQQIGAVGELRQQIARRRGGLSIRALLHRYASIMTEVTPCFLMSPVSVAKFLPAESVEFDVVVFDEASQIRVPEAIGAMGRGRSVVIVGDSQQMPPSSMFSASGSNVEEEASGEDLPVPVDMDSILTEGVEANLPRLMLSWHYRSKDESLIAFSNQHYYEGRLASFPAPPERASTAAVRLRRVDGVWEGGSRGVARVNRAEADAVYEEIGRQLREKPGRSIGVVTFNMQQRNLVLDLLEQSAEEDPLLRAALERADEPLFVKNLDNVQGDERDVILFTLAFAKDARGKVPLNWGPLTRVGGEKRLNVAVTRAKEEVVVFCSFDAHELDLATSRSEGLAHLKDYLLLARDGAGHALVKRAPSFDLHLREVQQRLGAAGLEVRSSIGLSTFTVDLAVRASADHPWLAVLLDGPAWAERLSVGDRDGLPSAVLTGRMGWVGVTRIWLAEWVRDADKVVSTVLERAHALTWPTAWVEHSAAGVSGATLEPDPADAVVSPMVDTEPRPTAVAGLGLAGPVGATVADVAAPVREPRAAANAPGQGAPARGASFPGFAATSTAANSTATSATTPTEGRSRFCQADATARHDRAVLDEPGRRAARLVAQELTDVVQAEGPILTARLAKLTAHRFGLDRLRGARERQILDRLPAELIRRSANGDEVAWPLSINARAYRDFRVPGDERTVTEVPYEELRNAMCDAVRRSFALGYEDCLRETARIFGWSRLGSQVRDRLDGVLRAAVNERALVVDGERLRASS